MVRMKVGNERLTKTERMKRRGRMLLKSGVYVTRHEALCRALMGCRIDVALA